MARVARNLTRFTRSEIDALFKNSKKVWRSAALDILRAPQTGTFGRLLIIASRKLGNAPVRNKLRRRLKSIFYEEKVYQKPYDWVLLLKKPITLLAFDELKKLLVRGLLND